MTDFDDPIPTSFEAWKHCIEHHCGIPLTRDFAEQRIRDLKDSNNAHTRRFVETYGSEHHHRVVGWFESVASGQG